MKAKIYRHFDKVDPLSTPDTVELRGDQLRAGMVLVDDLGCPLTGLDHRVRAIPMSGGVRFLTADLENGGWRERSFHRNSTFHVVAR